MKKLILTLTLLSVATFSHAEDVPGQNLLNYFQANCRSQGEWTKAALADSNALIETLRSIQNDPDCKTVGGAISSLNNLNVQLQSLASVNQTQQQIAAYNAQEQELMVQLSQTSNQASLNIINQNLRDLQVNRAGILGRERSQKDLNDPAKLEVLTGVINTANATFQQVTSNQKCLQKNPNVLNTATSVLSAIGATAAVVNPALGLGITAGAVLLGTTIESYKGYSNSRDIRRIADNSIAFEGYKCAIETMTDRWCQMKDAESFLAFKAQQRQGPSVGSGLAKAIRLNDREIPALLEWLNKVKSGVSPTNTADAGRQNTVLARELILRTSEGNGIGLIEQTRVSYNVAANRIEKWNLIKSIVNSLAPSSPQQNQSESYGPKSPLYDVYSRGYAPFQLLGLDDTGLQNPQTGEYYTLDTWPGRNSYNPDIDIVKAHFIFWVEKARLIVNQELSQVLQPDALQTLSTAYDPSGRYKTSPMDAIKSIVEFLEKNPPREHDMAFRKLYASTLLSLKGIHSVTETAVIEQDKPIDRIKKSPIEEIYELAQLKYGTVVLEARMDLIVRLSLLELLRTSPPADQVLVAQLLAAERFTETLSRMNGGENLARIRQDIMNAQPVTISNLNSFGELFGKNISKILMRLFNEERNATGTIARSKRNARTQMCHLLLGVPDILNYVNVSYCEGLKMDPLVVGGPDTPALNQNSYTRDYNDRACVYREFFRQTRIYENWGIRP